MLPVLRGESTISSTEILIVLHFKVHKSTLSRLENNRTKFCCLFFFKFKIQSLIHYKDGLYLPPKKPRRPEGRNISLFDWWFQSTTYLTRFPKNLIRTMQNNNIRPQGIIFLSHFLLLSAAHVECKIELNPNYRYIYKLKVFKLTER